MSGFITITLAIMSVSGLQADRLRVEPQTGTRIHREIATMPLAQEKQGRVLDVFSECVYDRNPKKLDKMLGASDFLNVDFDALDTRARYFARKYDLAKCLSKATKLTGTSLILGMDRPTFRAMMATRAYVAGNPVPPNWLVASWPELKRSFVSEGADLAKAVAAAKFADCVVAAAPEQSDALLRTPSTSNREQAAVDLLMPFLSSCNNANYKVEPTVPTIRAMVADGLWTAWQAVGAAQSASPPNAESE